MCIRARAWTAYGVIVLVAVGCSPAKPSLDEAVNTWSTHAVQYADKVTDPHERSSQLAPALAIMHAELGNGRLALTAAREVTDEPSRRMLASTLGQFLTEQESLEFTDGFLDQTKRDDVLKFLAFGQAVGRRYDVAERLVRNMNRDKQVLGFLAIVSAMRGHGDLQAAQELLDKAEPKTDADRELVSKYRADLERRRREAGTPNNTTPATNRHLESNLAIAQKDLQNAKDSHAQANAWLKVAELQRSLERREDCRKALQAAELAADKIEHYSLRTMQLARTANAYRELQDMNEVSRVAMKAVAVAREAKPNPGAASPELLFETEGLVDGMLTQPLLMVLLVETGHHDEAIEAARSNGQWKQLGCSAASSDQNLMRLEQHLDKIDSYVAKALVCAGVVEVLLNRKKEQSQAKAKT